jgi:hypothetical protein
MVGNSMTRYHWGTAAGAPEPAIPWCGFLFPDGSPVSYTEADRLREYTTGITSRFLSQTWLDTPSQFLTVNDSTPWSWRPTTPTGPALYELSLWADSVSGHVVVDAGGYVMTIDAAAQPYTCTGASKLGCFEDDFHQRMLPTFAKGVFLRVALGGAAPRSSRAHTSAPSSPPPLASVNVTARFVPAAWNLLRVLVEAERLRVWLNPTIVDITGASAPPTDYAKPPHLATPLVDLARPAPPPAAGLAPLAVASVGGKWRVDYVSVLPPKL